MWNYGKLGGTTSVYYVRHRSDNTTYAIDVKYTSVKATDKNLMFVVILKKSKIGEYYLQMLPRQIVI